MDASLMVLHLLLCLESLLALQGIAFELKTGEHLQVVLLDLRWLLEGTVADLTSLDKPFDATLVSEVGASQSFVGWRPGRWAVFLHINKANEKDFAYKEIFQA